MLSFRKNDQEIMTHTLKKSEKFEKFIEIENWAKFDIMSLQLKRIRKFSKIHGKLVFAQITDVGWVMTKILKKCWNAKNSKL